MFYIAFYRFLSLLTSFWLRNITAFMVIIIVLLEIAIIVLFHTIMPPVEDGGHTYIEALYLLKHHHSSDNIYFQVYPNNIPITILRYWLYRFFSLVSVSNYMFIDKTTCAAVLSVCIFFSWKLVIKLFDLRMGIIFLLMTATCFPYFFYIIYFYTDTIALMFPVICLYFWYLYQQSKKIRYLLLLSVPFWELVVKSVPI
ncbi:hypothetical protein QS257_14730 [Terrilactibacillus sp. S3-3]|nr:hypothetical protein QS257_14730 [Terrilactibacillus sp. S3-3]